MNFPRFIVTELPVVVVALYDFEHHPVQLKDFSI